MNTHLKAFCRSGLLGGLAALLVWMNIGACRAADAPDGSLVVFDLVDKREALDPTDPVALRRHYDEVLLATCLQGLVNRQQPRLFVRYNAASDDFWFGKMTEPGEWMANRQVTRIQSIAELLAKFPGVGRGLVVWDERVPATSNIAATVAGVDDLLAVRFDEAAGSLYRELTSGSAPWKVVRRLLADDGSALFTGRGTIPQTARPSSGSAKNDAYLWLLENYVKPGKTNPRALGYYIDGFWLKCSQAAELENHTLNNLDYLIANRAAILDLNVWEDEATVDDPGQPPGTDLKTLREILMACATNTGQKEMIAVHGFVSWAHKYTDVVAQGWHAGGKHEPVPTEWKWVAVLAAYNAYTEPDALGYSSFPNGSFYSRYPLPTVVAQDASPTREKLIRSGVLDQKGRLLPVNYYAHYQGDYDCPAWVYMHFPGVLADPARGTLPLSWASNPTVGERFTFGMSYIRRHAMPGEVFVAGEGAGYLNPSLLEAPRPVPGLRDALDVWAAHSKKWYQQWDINVTGFNIDGNAREMDDRAYAAYQGFSPGGLGSLRAAKPFGVRKNLPFIQMATDLPGAQNSADPAETARIVNSFFDPDGPNFVAFRSILQLPSYYADIQTRLQQPGNLPNKLVDLPTLFWLIREYTADPSYEHAGQSYATSKQLSADPETRAGLRTRHASDGVMQSGKADGEAVWEINGRPAYYVYFKAADDFAKSLAGGKGVSVVVTYQDDARVSVGLDYDSTDPSVGVAGAYKAAPAVPTAGAGGVKTATFHLPDALFSHRENGGSDFRVHANGKALRLRSVQIIRN